MIGTALAFALLAQEPAVQQGGEPRPERVSPAPAPSPAPDQAADKPTAPTTTPRAKASSGGAASSSSRPGARRSASCRNLTYADAHPDACRAEVIAEPSVVDETAAARPVPAPAQPAPAPKAGPAAQPDVAAAAFRSWAPLAGLGVAGAALLLAAAILVRRLTRRDSPEGLRAVELAGPAVVTLDPAALARGAGGPGRSRWTVRDGRLCVAGPAGTLLNGVPLDRNGDIVSTGDTVRLGGAEYRVRII